MLASGVRAPPATNDAQRTYAAQLNTPTTNPRAFAPQATGRATVPELLVRLGFLAQPFHHRAVPQKTEAGVLDDHGDPAPDALADDAARHLGQPIPYRHALRVGGVQVREAVWVLAAT